MQMRGALLTAALFVTAAVALSEVQPLWLDEVLQLIDTRDNSITELIARLPHHSGGVPLAYVVQQATLKVIGYSIGRARLPEALFGTATVFFVALLGAE